MKCVEVIKAINAANDLVMSILNGVMTADAMMDVSFGASRSIGYLGCTRKAVCSSQDRIPSVNVAKPPQGDGYL